MLYIKIEDNKATGYPMSEQILREALFNVSLPAVINPVELLAAGYAEFRTTFPPEAGIYQTVIPAEPTFDGTVATQQWELRNMGDQEKAAVDAKKLEESKSRQKQLLAQSDWTELPSVRAKNTDEWAQAWDEYRTALRDVDKLENWPFIADWPTPPDAVPDVPPGESI